jgi:hypothetical protein
MQAEVTTLRMQELVGSGLVACYLFCEYGWLLWLLLIITMTVSYCSSCGYSWLLLYYTCYWVVGLIIDLRSILVSVYKVAFYEI